MRKGVEKGEGWTKWYYLEILDLQAGFAGLITTLSGTKFSKIPRKGLGSCHGS